MFRRTRDNINEKSMLCLDASRDTHGADSNILGEQLHMDLCRVPSLGTSRPACTREGAKKGLNTYTLDLHSAAEVSPLDNSARSQASHVCLPWMCCELNSESADSNLLSQYNRISASYSRCLRAPHPLDDGPQGPNGQKQQPRYRRPTTLTK